MPSNISNGTLVADPTDLRDRYYEPSLKPLAPTSLAALSARIRPRPPILPYELRDQKGRGTCTGHALANLIDIQRLAACPGDAPRPARVSAGMLYRMAVQQERGPRPGGGDGISTLRSAIKGFYHNGVCPETHWPDDADDPVLSPERAMAAKGTTLGAYYRVRAYLNDYHAALSEADGILVSAQIHAGWNAVEEGAIPFRPDAPTENHAFVIVGYNVDGFLVLNSHGPGWGGFRSGDTLLDGVALWSYEDWSTHVLDAWVLRLGVPSPDAFTHSHSRRGIFFDSGPIRAASAPSHQLLGHFAHLDDGVHVTGGSYASSRTGVELTAGRIATRPDRPVHISLPGSLLGIDAAFHAEVDRRPGIEQGLGMYPYSVLWCNDMVESTSAVLEHLFDTAVRKVGVHSKTLIAEIEATTSGIGRAFWRDIRRAARRAGHHRHLKKQTPDDGEDRDGAVAEMFDHMAGTGARLHLTADGAGVLLLAEYLHSLNESDWLLDVAKRRARFLAAVSSLTLIAPTIRPGPFEKAFRPLIDALSEKGPDRVTLWVPSYGFERKLSVGHYARSVLDLVLYGFEGADHGQDHFIGMSAKRAGLADLCAPGGPLRGVSLRKIRAPDHDKPAHMRRRRYTQHDVIAHSACTRERLAHLAGINRQDIDGKEISDEQDHA